MDREWHVYWKNPGDSGLPTTVDWILPPGFTAGPGPVAGSAEIRDRWARHVRVLRQGHARHRDHSARRARSRATVLKLAARAGWLACRVECVPGNASLELSLPVGRDTPSADAQWAQGFNAARRLSFPSTGDAAVYSAAADSRTVTLIGTRPVGLKDAEVLFYPSSPGQVRNSSPQEVEGDGVSLRLRMERDTGSGALQRLAGAARQRRPAAGAGESSSIFPSPRCARSGLGLAARAAAGIRRRPDPQPDAVRAARDIAEGPLLRRSTAGNAARAGRAARDCSSPSACWCPSGSSPACWSVSAPGGRLLGWGFQFQDPVVVVVTAVLFFLIGLNLFGVFEMGTVLTGSAESGRGRGGGGLILQRCVRGTPWRRPARRRSWAWPWGMR